ncbi:hypothetical protein QQ045_031529 [Rhodiola kirilowii]
MKVKDSFLKKKLGKVAYAKNEYKFAAEYEELMKLLRDRPDVRMWLRNVNVQLWSLAMDAGGMRLGSMITNASKSFNGVLKHGRDLPISALVMFTFKQLNKYFNNHRYRYDNSDSAFAPKVHQSHAITACKFAHREYNDYVPHEYTLQAYNMTWSYHFSPLPHADF